jgi:PEP-CTERM motif
MKSLLKAAATLAFAGLVAVEPAFAARIELVAIPKRTAAALGSVATNGIVVTRTTLGVEVRSADELALPASARFVSPTPAAARVLQNSSVPRSLDFGFADSGTIDPGDSSQTATPLGSVVIPAEPSTDSSIPIELVLPVDFITALGSGFFGLTIIAGSGDTISVASLENPSLLFRKPLPLLETQSLRMSPDGGPPDAALSNEEPPSDGGPLVVPEPGWLMLLGSGLAALAVRARRQQRRRRLSLLPHSEDHGLHTPSSSFKPQSW